jgi:hypothetical protein
MMEKLGVKIKIDMKKAGLMRHYSEEGILTDERIFRILSGGITAEKKNPHTVKPVKLTGKVLSKYFQPEQTAKEIQAELIEALEFYRSNKK